MRQKFTFAANVDESRETDLSDDSSELSASGTDTVGGRPVSSGEDFTWDDESCGVGSEILEEVGHAVLKVSAELV